MARWPDLGMMTKVCSVCGVTFTRTKGTPSVFLKRKTCSKVCGYALLRKDMQSAFWAKVNKTAPNGCWEWTASRKEKGYGQFLWRGKMHRAHRLAWALSGNELPQRPLELAHICDNRICVNPDHLIVATHAENMADCKAKRRNIYGEKSPNSKLTETDVRTIRAEYWINGRGCMTRSNSQELADRFGVERGCITAIVRGHTWSHVK